MSEQPAGAGTERSDEDGPMNVPDEELPDDVRPGEDNPLAEPAGDDVPDDVLKEAHEGQAGGDSGSESGGPAKGGNDDTDPSSTGRPPGVSPDLGG